MARNIEKAEPMREEELELTEPLISEEAIRGERERSIERFRLVWNHRALVWRALAVGLVVTTLVAFLIPSKYTSSTRLMPPNEGSSAGLALLSGLAGKDGGGALGMLGSQLLGLKTSGDLFVGILGSRTVQDDLIAKFNLRKVYWDKTWEEARKDLASETDLSVDRKSEIITIAVTDRSPQRAADMGKEYVSELNHIVTDLNTSSAHRERVFLEGRLAQVQQNLEVAEEQFSEFASKNTAIDIKEQGKAMLEAGASLESQVIVAETELEGLRQIYTDDNVRVRAAQARVDELRKQLQQMGGKAGAPAPASAQDDELLYPSIRQLPLLGVTYANLYRPVLVQEAVFETLTKEYELAKVQEAKETPSVKVLDPAEVPERKSFPPRLLIIIVGTLLAGMFGIAWVLGKANWQAIDPQDPGKALAQEVFGTVLAHWPAFSSNGAKPEVVHGTEVPKLEPGQGKDRELD